MIDIYFLEKKREQRIAKNINYKFDILIGNQINRIRTKCHYGLFYNQFSLPSVNYYGIFDPFMHECILNTGKYLNFKCQIFQFFNQFQIKGNKIISIWGKEREEEERDIQ